MLSTNLLQIETFDQDYNYMFGQLGLLDLLGGKKEEDREPKSTAVLYEYFGKMGKDRILALYELYKADFELFGYEIPEGLL